MWNAFIKDEFKDDPKVKKAFENAWLGLHGIDEKKIFNPLEDIPTQFEGDIPTYITYLLSLPEYFPFFAEEFLNIKLAPFQCVILDELWKRKFPMLIASRGGSKTFSMAVHCLRRLIFLPERKIVIAGAGFRQSKLVFEYMEKIWDNAPLLRDIASAKGGRVGYTHEPDRHTFRLNGGTCLAIPIGNFGEKIRGLRAHDLICVTKDTLVQTDKGLIYIKDYLDGTNKNVMNIDKEFEKPSHIIITEPANVYKITTRNGFEIKCSDSHRIMTSNGWKMASELTINDYIEIDSNDYFPSDYVKHEDLIVDEEIGWLLGLLISEGSVESRHHIGITNTDYDLITRIKNRLNWDWKEYHRNEYVDKRGFDCKESWRIQFNCTGFREKLYKLGLDYSVHKDKTIPWCILQSPKSVVVEFLKGLFEGDGSLFSYSPTANTNKTMIGAAYYSRSRELCRTLQILLLKFGIYGAFTDKKYSNWSEYKQSVVQFRGEPAVLLYDLLKLKKCGLLEHEFSFKRPVPSIIRKKIKTDRFILSTWKGNKNTYIGSYDSEEECYKAFDEYWVNTRKCFKIKSIKKLAKKEVLYDFHLPKKHSFIGNGIVNHNCDEFSAIPRNIFETVLAGFTVVSSDPVSGMMQSRFEEIAREEGWWDDEQVSDTGEKISNSLVISGTPGFSFQHFCAYWKDWKDIILSGGEQEKLQEYYRRRAAESGQEVEEIKRGLNYRNYSVIRIPYELIPDGFMEKDQVARAKATMHSGTYQNEYAAVFSGDSLGFFKRSLIESCVASPENIEIIRQRVPDAEIFEAILFPNKGCKYVMAIDTAMKIDKFAIIIIEVRETHRRIIYCWTTDEEQFRREMKRSGGAISEDDYYTYCASKILRLQKIFDVKKISIDAQGGGQGIVEALHNRNKVPKGYDLIWPIEEMDVERYSDGQPGLHIIEEIQFSKYDWVQEANNSLRQDMENKVILFPHLNPISIGIETEMADLREIEETELERCALDVEELKNELTSIVVTELPSKRLKWDTPEQKDETGKIGRMRKDRYSALLMANMAAREYHNVIPELRHESVGGFTRDLKNQKSDIYYSGKNSEFNKWAKQVYGQ